MNIMLSRRTTITLLLRALSQALLCAANAALADNHNTLDKQAIDETIRKALPNTKIDSVTVSIIPGLVEIVAGDNVLYIAIRAVSTWWWATSMTYTPPPT